MCYSIRLHHFKPWYEYLHNPDSFKCYDEERELFRRAEKVERSDGEPFSENYLDFVYSTVPAFFETLELTDFIDVIHGMDSICALCPDPVPDKCGRADGMDNLLMFCNIEPGQRYRVADIMDLFAEYKKYMDSDEISVSF
ncbi:hypothetical protein GOV10_01745 [Candidatus Woesearchaeota archaeon]|nr:hypothetical protein [Candidatus Woesearchaeota archaeon]